MRIIDFLCTDTSLRIIFLIRRCLRNLLFSISSFECEKRILRITTIFVLPNSSKSIIIIFLQKKDEKIEKKKFEREARRKRNTTPANFGRFFELSETGEDDGENANNCYRKPATFSK